MANAWYVGIAESGRGKIYLAAYELFEVGFQVYVPLAYTREKLASGATALTTRPKLETYFFVNLDAARQDNRELRTALDQRGVKAILCSYAKSGERGGPQSIPRAVIDDYRAQELADLRGSVPSGSVPKKRESRKGLELLGKYRVIGGIAAGAEGKLVAFERGLAHLDINGMLWSVADRDISPVDELAA
jgi:hypothetical protein